MKNLNRSLFADPPRHHPDAVYVGSMEFPFCGMIMSHMASENIEALHQMADKIGVARRHFQDDDKHLHPHYDICKSKKELAIKFGAIEINDRDLNKRCHPKLMKLFESSQF
jgi:hypothetical protein